MHYYQFNIGDFASHTRHLTLLENLAYRLLLDLYYLHERPLNSGLTSVARQIGMRDNEEEVRAVLDEFFVLTDDGWINKRADIEIAQYHAKLEQASKAGKASAAKRTFNGRSTDVQPNINQEPITNNQDKHTPAKAAAFCFKTELLNLGIPADLADDWMKVRKAKKATNTKTAFNMFKREVEKSGWSASDAVSHCIKKDWKGFDSEWVKDIKPIQQPSIQFDREAYEAKRKADLAVARERYQREQEAISVAVAK